MSKKKRGASLAVQPNVLLLERFAWQSATLALLVLLAYANAIGAGFHFDDYAILRDGYIANPGFGLGIFRFAQTRPLTYLTFHWNYLLGAEDATGYHWVNLFLHMANCILLLALARRYLSPRAAGCVAAIFALHPLQTEAVTYVFARSTLLCTFFALWTLWFHSRGRWACSALMFGLSLLAKEETVALPAFLLLLDAYQSKRVQIPYYALLGGFAAAAAARLFYLISTAPLDPGIGRVKGITTLVYLLTQGRVLWVYLRMAVLPIGLNLDHDVALSKSLVSPWTTLPAWLGLIALACALLWFARARHAAAVWTLGFFVLILPSSSIVPQADLMFEHRTYLPMVCLLIGIGFLIQHLSRSALIAGLAVLVPAMLAGTIHRNFAWHDEKSLWSDVIAKSPGKPRAYLGLAAAYLTEDPSRSRELLRKGLKIDPSNAELHTNYGVALMRADDPGQAVEEFRRAMALSGENADHWNNIGAAWYVLHDTEQSMRSYGRALELDPCSYQARHNLVMLYGQRGELSAAYEAGEVPATCHLVQAQAADLERYRRQVGIKP